ncbi:MAG: hypothetical protein L0323_01835 [Planctomycetes bacterium]|nr:hypothetical protein [Planctomycetota bacterium]
MRCGRPRFVLLLLPIGTALAACAAEPVRYPAPPVVVRAGTDHPARVYFTESWAFSAPPGATDEERLRATVLATNREPLPPGWGARFGGGIEAIRTGRTDCAGNLQVLVTVVDDRREDLERAALLLDGTVVFRADRKTGAIVDTASGPVASLAAFVPPMPPFTVTLRRWDRWGRRTEEELAFKEPGKFEGGYDPGS